ncbi:unnamed protein product, partial [Rotaria sp. Silwood1]
DHISSK